jgi:hypothetical protein
MVKKKKKKRSTEQLHRQVQDSLLVLPKYVEQQQKEGKRFRAFMLRFVTGPMLRLMNRALSARRYRGEEGEKLKQTEKMRRHLQHKDAAIKHIQANMPQAAKRRNRPG